MLELTASGQRARKRVDEARRRVAERMVAALEDRDLADFERIAKRLLAALERTGGVTSTEPSVSATPWSAPTREQPFRSCLPRCVHIV